MWYQIILSFKKCSLLDPPLPLPSFLCLKSNTSKINIWPFFKKKIICVCSDFLLKISIPILCEFDLNGWLQLPHSNQLCVKLAVNVIQSWLSSLGLQEVIRLCAIGTKCLFLCCSLILPSFTCKNISTKKRPTFVFLLFWSFDVLFKS